jgi:hypothetical protein
MPYVSFTKYTSDLFFLPNRVYVITFDPHLDLNLSCTYNNFFA